VNRMHTLQETTTRVGRTSAAELARAAHAAVHAGESALHRSAHRVGAAAAELEDYGGHVAARARHAQHSVLPHLGIPDAAERTRRYRTVGLACAGLLALGGGALAWRRAARKHAEG